MLKCSSFTAEFQISIRELDLTPLHIPLPGNIISLSAASGKPVKIRRGPAAVTGNETATAISHYG